MLEVVDEVVDGRLLPVVRPMSVPGSESRARTNADAWCPFRKGSIVNIASGAGLVSVPGFAGYAAAKHGQVGADEGCRTRLRRARDPGKRHRRTRGHAAHRQGPLAPPRTPSGGSADPRRSQTPCSGCAQTGPASSPELRCPWTVAMSPAERPLQSATIAHFGLSVGDLDAMVAFYTRLGFDEIARIDFAPAPVRLVVVRNRVGATLELTAHGDSAQNASADSATDAARKRGVFQFAMRVARLEQAVEDSIGAGARQISAPAANSRGEYRFAYVADPGKSCRVRQPATLTSLLSRSRSDLRGEARVRSGRSDCDFRQ